MILYNNQLRIDLKFIIFHKNSKSSLEMKGIRIVYQILILPWQMLVDLPLNLIIMTSWGVL